MYVMEMYREAIGAMLIRINVRTIAEAGGVPMMGDHKQLHHQQHLAVAEEEVEVQQLLAIGIAVEGRAHAHMSQLDCPMINLQCVIQTQCLTRRWKIHLEPSSTVQLQSRQA